MRREMRERGGGEDREEERIKREAKKQEKEEGAGCSRGVRMRREMSEGGEGRGGGEGKIYTRCRGWQNVSTCPRHTHPHLPRRRADSFAYPRYLLAPVCEGKFTSTPIRAKRPLKTRAMTSFQSRCSN